MKFKALVLTASMIFSLIASGQKPVTVDGKQLTFKHGTYQGLVLTVPEVDASVVQKEWIKVLEQGTKSKVVTENGELSIFGARMTDIYESPINVYTRITSADSLVRLESVYELRPKEFISGSETSKEYAQARMFMFEFGRGLYADVAKAQLKAEEKTLGILEDKLNDLYSDKTKMEKSIVDSKNTISQSENEITTLKSDLLRLNDQLSAEKAALASLQTEELKKQKESEIKSIEKSIKRAMDNINDDEKKIIDNRSSITTNEVNISSNIGEQENVKYQINQQKIVVQAAETKHRNIVNSTLN